MFQRLTFVRRVSGRLVSRPLTPLMVLALIALAVSAVVLGAAFAGDAVAASGDQVVTLGADLSSAQRQQMLDLFGVGEDEVRVVEVTNSEERAYFEGSIPDEQLGSRAISSVHVLQKDPGDGVSVETENITYITPQTYANAMVTAGVADADVFAAAPFPVSGTAALTGIFKAFEEASGEEISEQAKEVASQELVLTSQMGEATGDPDALASLIAEVKRIVVSQGLDSADEIRQVVIDVAAELNITLTEEQITQIVELVLSIQKLDIDPAALVDQLKDFQQALGITDEEAQGLWERIQDLFSDVWNAIFG